MFPPPDYKETLRGVHEQKGNLDCLNILNRLRYDDSIPGNLKLLREMPRRQSTDGWLQIAATNKEVDDVNCARLNKMDSDPSTIHAQIILQTAWNLHGTASGSHQCHRKATTTPTSPRTELRFDN